MNPGNLNRRIRLYTEGPVSETYNTNEPAHTDTLVGSYWAKYEPLSDSENFVNEMLVVESRAKFTIRFKRINETYKIKYENRWYGIEGIIPIERRQYLEITARTTQQTNFRT